MLEELRVRDLALISDVWIEFGPGMTALTGETGAGKTVLVGALKFLVGERADATMVRSGADEAVVEGRFRLDGREVVARRRMSSEGRSRCTLDGEMATVTALAETLGPLVDLHGQHEHQALLSPACHAGYLDRFGGDDVRAALETYRAAYSTYSSAASELAESLEAGQDRESRRERLRFQVGEIDAVAPHPGEDVELEARLPALRHASKLTEAAGRALVPIGDDDGVAEWLGAAHGALRSANGLDPALDEIATSLGDVTSALDDVTSRLRDYAERLEHDPRVLDEVESRLAALALLKRKYGPALSDVLHSREEAAAALDALDAGRLDAEEAERRLTAAAGELGAAGERLGALRRSAVDGFAGALVEAAADLALEEAVFEVGVSDLPFESWTLDGPQRVEFLFSSTRSEPSRPLARIASGGEVSRVMLALKSVLGQADDVPILVFDEVDAGIGGATAHAVGRRLAELASGHQVLVVTHLAQVAAYADWHFVVSRSDDDGITSTTVMRTDGEARVAEVARMLSGTDSEAGLAHARELMLAARAHCGRHAESQAQRPHVPQARPE